MRPSFEISVIVPAYQEVLNLSELTERLFATFDRAKRSAELIIIDDSSDDGTIELCAELAKSFPVRLITRTEERGLATAVICGLRAARSELLVVMDADLSHPPEFVPLLIEPLESDNADFVIGSRYVEGGAIDKSWSLLRYINSRAATLLASGLTQAKDPMAGFFAMRSSSIPNPAELNPCGFKIGLELIVRCSCQQIVEVPIRFADRRHGESKLSFREQWLFIRHLIRLYMVRFPDLGRFARFALVGATGVVIDLLSFRFLLLALGFGIARAVAIWIAMTWNFALNRRFTFSDSPSSSRTANYLRFCASCLIGGSLSWGISVALTNAFDVCRNRPILVAVIGTVIAAFFNYSLCCKWVFARRKTVPFQASVAVEWPDPTHSV